MPRASSTTASVARADPSSPATRSGQITTRRPSRSASGCSMIVAMATGTSACTASTTSARSGNVSALIDSTYTSMIPPQVRPTANASSSLTP